LIGAENHVDGPGVWTLSDGRGASGNPNGFGRGRPMIPISAILLLTGRKPMKKKGEPIDADHSPLSCRANC